MSRPIANTPTIKRILREAHELASHPSPDYHARPLHDTSLFEWHFTLRGPPPPSPFSSGIYHGRITLPPTYPLRPPSFRFLTPSGRFEVNREICLSISGHHEETWLPAWGIRTALVALRSFMDTPVEGQVGGMEGSEDARRRLAGGSRVWRCRECAGGVGEGMTNEEVLEAERKRWDEMRQQGEGSGEKEESVPEELKLAYRDELQPQGKKDSSTPQPQQQQQQQTDLSSSSSSSSSSPPESTLTPTPTPTVPLTTQPPTELRQRTHPPPAPQPRQQPQVHAQQQQQQQQRQQDNQPLTNLDRVILLLLFLLIGLVWRKLGKVDVEIVY